MAIQYSVAVRDAQNNAVETTIGVSPTLEIRTGAAPANCAAADTGTVLVTITLPSDWMAASSSGLMSKAGTWTASASGTGTAGHYRIKAGATCHMQGTVSQQAASGGTGDLKLGQATADLVSGQTVTITQFDITRGNA